MGIGPRARRLLIALGCVALAAAVVIGLTTTDKVDSGDGKVPSTAEAEAVFARAPAEIKALYDQRNQLLDGGEDAFRERLKALRGHPVVVNKWAAWCDPCRGEFPMFQRQAVEYGRRVAFLGVDSLDNDEDARDFLEERPVPYPSYKDPEQEIAAVFDGVAAFPSTAFYDSKGKLQYLKQGAYLEESKLVEDIERYAK
jgi:cytochrome c biogenesis protein CcmG/thiol:disulfide interchange protein DsbE